MLFCWTVWPSSPFVEMISPRPTSATPLERSLLTILATSLAAQLYQRSCQVVTSQCLGCAKGGGGNTLGRLFQMPKQLLEKKKRTIFSPLCSLTLCNHEQITGFLLASSVSSVRENNYSPPLILALRMNTCKALSRIPGTQKELYTL